MSSKAKSLCVLALSLVILSTLAPTSEGLKKQEAVARKEDIPYIRCQVCQKLTSEFYHQVQKKESQISPKKISEYQIIEIAENVCNLKKEEADWILKIDIVEQGDKLELVEQEEEGQCNSECKTIERACQVVLGDSDTDLAEYVYAKKPKLDDLVNYLCKDLTEACSTKPPPVPKHRTPGEPFVPKPSKEAEMEKMLRSMQGMPGAPNMQMYSREDLMKQNLGGGGGDEDDEDEDEDDDTGFPTNLKKVLREKQTKKPDDWKDKITKQVVDAGETIKRHATKASNKFSRWWKTKIAEYSKKKPASGKLDL